MKKISVIVAAYNIEQYIERCLKSIINQTLNYIEIIVVNDGSTDNTLSKIKKIATYDNRIKVIDKINQGLIEARKSGLKQATGKYILFIDGDDWLEKEALNILYKKAEDDLADIVIYNAFDAYDNGKKDKKIYKEFVNSHSDYLKELFLSNLMPAIWSKLIRLEFIKSNNIEFPQDISYAEDLATSVSLFIKKPRISFISQSLYNYYKRHNSITNIISDKILEINTAIEFIEKKLKQEEIYYEYQKEFERMIYEHIFETRFLVINIGESLHKKLYDQYINKKINIKNNEYILNIIQNYPIGLKVRVYLYLKNYIIGKIYDNFRNFIKVIINLCIIKEKNK